MIRALTGSLLLAALCAAVAAPGLHASEKTAPAAKSEQPAAVARTQIALATLQRAPGAMRDSLQATAALSSRQVCHVANGMVSGTPIEHIDSIATFLAKDVHGWSDLMLAKLLKSDRLQVKFKSKAELREQVLRKWDADRGKAQKWLAGCGVMVSALIAGTRGKFERESSGVFDDIVAVIATGVRNRDPDAVRAAEALAGAEKSLKLLLP